MKTDKIVSDILNLIKDKKPANVKIITDKKNHNDVKVEEIYSNGVTAVLQQQLSFSNLKEFEEYLDKNNFYDKDELKDEFNKKISNRKRVRFTEVDLSYNGNICQCGLTCYKSYRQKDGEDLFKTLGKNIRYFTRQTGGLLSQKELSILLGCTYSAIYGWALAKVEPPLSTISYGTLNCGF